MRLILEVYKLILYFVQFYYINNSNYESMGTEFKQSIPFSNILTISIVLSTSAPHTLKCNKSDRSLDYYRSHYRTTDRLTEYLLKTSDAQELDRC